MRIVVIGGTRHIGSCLVPLLLSRRHEVVVVNRGFHTPYWESPLWARVETFTINRDAEEASGSFGRKIAGLQAEAIVDMICFSAESGKQMVEALCDRIEQSDEAIVFLYSDIKAAATRLEKGQLILSHAVFREPVEIKFPMVAYKQPS